MDRAPVGAGAILAVDNFMITIAKSDLRTRMREILDLAENGETIVITDLGKPVARIVKPEPEDFPGPKTT